MGSTYTAQGLVANLPRVMIAAQMLQFAPVQDPTGIRGAGPDFGRVGPFVGGISSAMEGLFADIAPQFRPRVNELLSLQENWDGEGGKPIKKHVLADAIQLATELFVRQSGGREPFIAPCPSGFVQLEWHGKTRSLEIEAVAEGWCIVGTQISDNRREYFSAECDRTDFERLKQYYSWFTGAELIWPSFPSN